MKKMKGFVILCAVLGVTTTGWSQEVIEKGSAGKHGIRIGVGNSIVLDEVETEDGFTSDLEKSGGTQIDILYAKRFMGRDGNNPVGAMIAGGAFMTTFDGELADAFGTVTADITAVGMLFESGIAGQIGNVVVLELTGFIGLGVASVDIKDDFDSFSGDGVYGQIGVKSGAYFQIGRHVELGVELGVGTFSSVTAVDFGGGDEDLTWSGSGVKGAFVVAGKF